MLERLLKSVRSRPSQIEPRLMAQNGRYSKYEIGDWSYGTPTVFSNGTGVNLTIGKFCSIADGVTFLLDAEHRADWVSTYPFNSFFADAASFHGHPNSKGDIRVGNDVWIGLNALILSGVTIGNGAVVGACSVVTKDVAPYAVVAGNPAKQIKSRFPAPMVASLQEIAWWEWPLSKIEQAWPLLLSPNIDDFVDRYLTKKP